MNKPPPVNLKERIAALQQKNAASSTPTVTTTSSSGLPVGQPRSLRDKISQFEEKGGVPIPRGSFGLGAPPVSDGQRSRELYGNRIPTPVRVPGNAGNGPNSARIGSPMTPSLTGTGSRKMSVSAADFDNGSPSSETGGGPYSNFQRGMSPQNTGGPALLTPQTTGSFMESIPRGTAFAAALQKAKKLESGILDNDPRHLREGSASPKSLPQSRYLFAQSTGESVSSETMSELALSGIQVSERRKSYIAPQSFADIRDTIPLTPEPDVSAERFSRPPMIQVTADLLPIPYERAEDEPPLSAFEAQPCYQDQLHLLPTVTCSDCNEEISIMDLAEHHCDPPRSPLPISPLPIESDHPQEVKETIEEVEAVCEEPVSMESVSIAEPPIPVPEPQFSPLVEPPTPIVQTTELVDEPSADFEDPVSLSTSLPEELSPTTPVSFESPQRDVPANTMESHVIAHVEPSQYASFEPPQRDVPLSIVDSHVITHFEPSQQASFEPPQHDVPLSIMESHVITHLEPSQHCSPTLVDNLESETLRRTPLEAEADQFDYKIAPEPDPAPPQPIIHVSPTEHREPSLHEEPPTPVLEDIVSVPVVVEEIPSELAPTLTSPISPRSQRSLPPRPVSMIVESPTRPAESVRSPFLIPSAREHPNLPITSPEETEFGTVSFHRATYSLSHSSDFVSHFAEPSPTFAPVPNPPSFSAVVHGKITELPAHAGQPNSPQVVKRHRAIRDSIPVTPATGDLASLLANAALLERKLMQGELPSEVPEEVDQEPNQVVSPNGTIDSVVEQLERWKPVEHIKPQDAKSRRKRSFRNPLVRSKSVKDSAPQADDFFEVAARARSLYDHSQGVRARAASTYYPPPRSVETHIRAHSQGSQLTIKTTHEPNPPTPPPKSPHAKYLSGIRRFAVTHPRQSVSVSSELSSEDSVLVITPPNRSPDVFATSNLGPHLEAGYVGAAPSKTGGITWPSLSTKKSLGSLGRASTFAEKIWSRKRSKSNSSSTSNSTDFAERLAAESMHVPLPERAFNNSPTPPLPKVIAPSSSRGHAPLRSKSFHSTRTPKDEDDFLIPSLPAFEPASQLTSLLAPPAEPSDGKIRPASWASTATTSSSLTSPSPILDAFPAVPDSPPTLSPPINARPASSFASVISTPTDFGHQLKPNFPSTRPSTAQ